MLKIVNTKGNSMLYFACDGDKIIYDNENYNIDIGDIVIYRVDDQNIAHRVIYIYDEQIIVAGDNCRKTECISKSKIFGKAMILLKKNKNYNISCNNKYRKELVEFLREFFVLNDKYIDYFLSKKYGIEYEKCLELYHNRNIKQQRYLESVEI